MVRHLPIHKYSHPRVYWIGTQVVGGWDVYVPKPKKTRKKRATKLNTENKQKRINMYRQLQIPDSSL